MKEVKDILVMEIKRIREAAQHGRLGMEDLRALESLTRSWKNYFGNEIDTAKETLSELSIEDLKKLVGDGEE